MLRKIINFFREWKKEYKLNRKLKKIRESDPFIYD